MYVAHRIDRTSDLHALVMEMAKTVLYLSRNIFHQTFITPHSLTFHNTFFFLSFQDIVQCKR